MRHERALALLVLSELILAVSSIVSDFVLDPFLPSSLRAYMTAERPAAFGLGDTFLAVLWAVVAVATVLAWIGLLKLLRPARSLYLGSWVGYLILLLLRGPIVSSAIGYVLQMLTALVGGMILGIVYFSELRSKFRVL